MVRGIPKGELHVRQLGQKASGALRRLVALGDSWTVSKAELHVRGLAPLGGGWWCLVVVNSSKLPPRCLKVEGMWISLCPSTLHMVTEYFVTQCDLKCLRDQSLADSAAAPVHRKVHDLCAGLMTFL